MESNLNIDVDEYCSEENSILEADLKQAIKYNSLEQLHIMELEDNTYYLVVNLSWAAGKNWYLCTQRSKTPRIFKDLTRMNDYLKEKFPTNNVILHRNQILPKEAE